MSLTASKAVQRLGFAPFLPEIHHVPYGYRYRCEYCRGEQACNRRCVSWIEQELFAKKVPPESVAAIFVEPIQGEGGYVVPTPAGSGTCVSCATATGSCSSLTKCHAVWGAPAKCGRANMKE